MFKAYVLPMDVNKDKSTWYLNLGGTNYVTKNSSNMFGLKKIEKANIYFISGTSYNIVGKYNVQLEYDGKIK